MCGIGEAAAVVSGLGSMLGAAEQNRYNRQAASASQGAAIAEMGRQDAFRDQGRQSFSSLLTGLSPSAQTAGLQDLTNSRTAVLTGAARGLDPGAVPLLDSAGPGIGAGIAEASRRRVGTARQDAASMARLGAVDDLNLANARRIQSGNTDLAHIADAAGGSASLLPTDQNAAVSNVKPVSGLGDLVTGVGRLGVLYGATRPATAGAGARPNLKLRAPTGRLGGGV